MLLKLEVTAEEARFLQSQLESRLDELDDELVHTDSRALQHALADDERMLERIIEKLEGAVAENEARRPRIA
ncbi:hypothetical protein L6R52_15315 [Myxococcota bacterium]|nr:hypothetical protein [Myxococcota bacterium]